MLISKKHLYSPCIVCSHSPTAKKQNTTAQEPGNPTSVLLKNSLTNPLTAVPKLIFELKKVLSLYKSSLRSLKRNYLVSG